MNALLMRLVAGTALMLLVVVLALLFDGADRIISARMQRRLGPPLLQPFLDLLKLLGRQTGTSLDMRQARQIHRQRCSQPANQRATAQSRIAGLLRDTLQRPHDIAVSDIGAAFQPSNIEMRHVV